MPRIVVAMVLYYVVVNGLKSAHRRADDNLRRDTGVLVNYMFILTVLNVNVLLLGWYRDGIGWRLRY
jgi:hypothetical protein